MLTIDHPKVPKAPILRQSSVTNEFTPSVARPLQAVSLLLMSEPRHSAAGLGQNQE